MARTPTTDIPLGFEAPSFALLDSVTGTSVTSDDVFAGGPTVVVFMCNHCPFVVHILEAFVAFASECRGKGVNVVA
ncbi:MAG: redoxin domain-containing protein, partial [Flavobacteriales bacterium]